MRKVNWARVLLITMGLCFLASLGIVRAQQPYSVPTTTTIPFYIQFGKVDGSLYQAVPVTANAAITTTLTGSGNTATGATISITVGSANDSTGTATISLPAPVVGAVYDVNFLTSLTAGTLAIKTDAATTFIAGGLAVSSSTGTSSGGLFQCNGTSHIQMKFNGTTQGGLIGTWIRLKALSTTLWSVTGSSAGSGVAATPCST